MPKKNTKLVRLFLIPLLSISLLITSYSATAVTKKKKVKTSRKLFSVSLTIDKGSSSKSYTVKVPAKSTVFTALKTASKKHKFSLKYSNYSYGVFVEEIAGLKNNPAKSMYWLYYINKKLANLGASAQKVKKGDKILWKFEKTN